MPKQVFLFSFLGLICGTSYGMGFLAAEEKEISSGQFRGFVIGESKADTIPKIIKLHGADLMSIPSLDAGRVVAVDSDQGRAWLAKANGIRLRNTEGFDVSLFFEGDTLVQVQTTLGPDGGVIDVRPGQSRKDVEKEIQRRAKSGNSLSVEKIARIDSAYWGKLNKIQQKALDVLLGYDGWYVAVYEEKPAGARYRLYFENDRLTLIKYQRPRFAK
jgi:hypothetical protein